MMQLCDSQSLEYSQMVCPQVILPVGNPSQLTNNQKKSARRARELIGKNKGRWSKQEQHQYFVFLTNNLSYFDTKDNRRFDKVFKMMAGIIKTRTSDQCRTHHQKLQARYKKFTKIMQSLKSQFGQVEATKATIEYGKELGLGADDFFNNTGFSSASKTSYSTQNSEHAQLDDPEDFYFNTGPLDESVDCQLEEVDILVSKNSCTSFLNFLD